MATCEVRLQARRNETGLFESANRGTVFLDEIEETSPNMQTRLLRVIEEREVQLVGSMDRIPVDIRVIAATNRALQELVNEGQFREDLYYRLTVVTIRRRRPEYGGLSLAAHS